MWSIVSGDSASEFLDKAKVSRAPSHFIAERKQAACLAANGALARSRSGKDVGVDTPRQIEAALRGSGNVECEFYSRHGR